MANDGQRTLIVPRGKKQVIHTWDFFCKDDLCKIVADGVKPDRTSNYLATTNGFLQARDLERKLFSLV